MPERFDLVVIGAGPAGEKGAVQAAYFGKRVAIVEQAAEPGGAGVHTGTLPSKTLREAALFVAGQRAHMGTGLEVSPHASDAQSALSYLMSRKRSMAASESRRVRDNLESHAVRYLQGRARIVDGHCVEVSPAHGESYRLSADVILIATGSVPARPAGIDFADTRIHDSDEILDVDEVPESLAVIGAGVIGCEYACMFAALGTRVTLLDARTELLPFLDRELVARLSDAMYHAGITLQLGGKPVRVARQGADIVTTFGDGRELRTAHVLYCAGRTARTAGLGLEALGIAVNDRGQLGVDDGYRTAVPSILAAGDVIGFPGLASTGMEQARVAVCQAFGFAYKRAVAALMPLGIYTIPALSAVGETETGCVAKGIDCVVGRARYADNARAKIIGDERGLLKLVVRRSDRRLLGVHIIGERATELVHIGQAVIELQGRVDTFIDMVWNYPTLSEIYKYAAYDCLAALGPRT